MGFFAIMCFSSSAYAATITWNNYTAAGGATLTVGTAATSITFSASPGVIINGSNTLINYCILTGNIKAGADAIAYNVASGSGRVAQRAVNLSTATDATALGTPNATGDLLSTFTTK